MKATITNISAKGEHVKVLVEKKFGPVISQMKGWMKKEDDCKIGDTFTIPEGTCVEQVLNDGYAELVLS